LELSHVAAVFVVAVIDAAEVDDDFVLLFIILIFEICAIFFGNFLVKRNENLALIDFGGHNNNNVEETDDFARKHLQPLNRARRRRTVIEQQISELGPRNSIRALAPRH
jgi:hypothetical protein